MSFSGFIKRNAFWIKDFFNGRKVRKHFCQIKRGMRYCIKAKERQQSDLLKLLNHATTNSEFYKKYAESELLLDHFPVVNKNILNQNADKVAVAYNLIPEQETENIHVQKTSGSTGTPFCVLQDSRKRYRRIAELKYFGEDVGFKSHEKLAQCRVWTNWHNKSKKQSIRENIYPVNVSKMDDETLSSLCYLVKKEKNSFITCLR